MTIYRNNGENWYADIQPRIKRLRRWFVRTGWEAPHWTRAGYSYRWQARHTIRLAFRARGHRSWLYALYASLCPLSFLGGRVTFQHFGVSAWSRRRRAWYCLHAERQKGRRRWYAYRSHNATPWGADTWYFGAPRDVVQAADAHATDRTADREKREAA